MANKKNNNTKSDTKITEEVIGKKKKKKGKKEGKHFSIGEFFLGFLLVIGILGATLFLILCLYIIITAPNFDKDLLYTKEATIVYDLNGNELIRTGKDNISLVSYAELPEVLVDAIVATEDSRFFQHTGLDAPRFVVATLEQLTGNSDAGGASTLSMQVIKNTYTSSEASGIDGILRKLTDVYMSIFKLENSYTKEEIIEFYVNSQWLGNDNNVNYTSITGVEQGSQLFFGKSVSELSLAEATIIAGMFQNPVSHNPYNYPENARARQTTVLTLMVRHGYITEAEKEAVLAIPIESLLAERESGSNNYLQASIDYVLSEVEDLTGYNPYIVPMEIYSTIDPEVQQVLNDVETGKSYSIPEERGNLQFGIAVTDMVNGSISALSAGINYQAKGLNRAVEQRQPGSTAKPIFAYGPYIEYLNGSPGTLFVDGSHSYSDGTTMNNWDNQYKGIMTMRDALVQSRNIPALKAFQEVAAIDLGYIEDFAHSLGINYGSALYESASIGGFDGVSPLQMSAAYATFGREGYYIEPYSVTRVILIETQEIIEHKYVKESVMSKQTAYFLTDMLSTAGSQGYAGFTVSGTDIAVKTGTTNVDEAARDILGLPSSVIMDNWVVSYNPEYSISTWIGYDSLSKDAYITMTTAAPVRNGISTAVGSVLYSKNKTFSEPTGLVTVTVESDTFPLQLASSYTPSSMKYTDSFIKGSEPTVVSTRYSQLSDIKSLNGSFKNDQVTLSWSGISTPDAISTSYLEKYFNTYYGAAATTYYNNRLSYNKSTIGTIEYEVYQVIDNKETLVGSTASNTLTFTPLTDGTVKYTVKTAYTIFKSNRSSGVSVNVTGNAIVVPEEPVIPEDTTTENENVDTDIPSDDTNLDDLPVGGDFESDYDENTNNQELE